MTAPVVTPPGDVVQKAAAPIAFIAILTAAALGVAVIVKRFGASLPLPAYLVDLVTDDDEDDQDDEEDE